MSIRTIELILCPEEEERVAAAILDRFEGVRLLDGRPWVDQFTPPVEQEIGQCGPVALIWPSLITPELPVAVASGVVRGPQIGPVIQWVRSRRMDPSDSEPAVPVIRSGRWASSITASDPPGMKQFSDVLWRFFKKNSSNRIIRANPDGRPCSPVVKERKIWVGRATLEKAKRGELLLAADRMRFVPE